ncbi:serine protease 33-like [Nymphalis io]|uniref:serine protease 33-like n=1 Tax=Inachis io TaxID=171585 RepID=UPI00216A7816|nr:serine protease 33-like [Nymphalis io]
MFIIKDNETWSSGVMSYTIHPEYEFATYNTIALVELAEHYQDELKPICWPQYSYNTSNNLFAVGYTDENKFLEKLIYKLEYVDQPLCNEFYNRIGFKNNLYIPSHYFCAFAKNNKKNCVWENGMALVSNTTGPWVLIGFGIKGPGCAGPSRFIDILKFQPWIEASTDNTFY